jgi:hypothetical protein
MVPKTGLEPARILSTTPSRWRVYQFHHFGIRKIYNIFIQAAFLPIQPLDYQCEKSLDYLLTGAGGTVGSFAASGLGTGTGSLVVSGLVTGIVCSATGGFCSIKEDELLWLAIYVSIRDVSIKTIATPAVIFPKNVPAPEEPKTVWLEPPNAAPILAPLPACRSTIVIKTKQTKMCKIVNNAYIRNLLLIIYFLKRLDNTKTP